MDKSRCLSLGIVATFLMVCGGLMGLLTWMLSQKILDGVKDSGSSNSLDNLDGPVWIGGIIYVIPGFLALIAALVQNKCVYVLSCIVSLLCSAIVGIVLFIAGFTLVTAMVILIQVKDSCDYDEIQQECRCGDQDSDYGGSTVHFKTCEYLFDFTNISLGLLVVIIVGFIVTLAVFVIALVFACRTKRTAGVVYTPAQQPMLQG